ncbi:type IV secretory system conjugative DNA transfer family protein [Paenibacillus sp. WLX2291]|uniref:type IV secretory system conjugative DNA transfer family protein n=1 Tax=Paenibacillus sp. WLX2291 TaxID=3296934 RepID=UPI003983DBD5
MKQVTWGGMDCFTNMLVIGPPRCGKTATILKPIIYQLLLAKKRGVKLGISVVEPKGDTAEMVAEMCGEMDLPCHYIDPLKANSASFPVMKGDEDDVAEAMVSVLKSMFGKQEAFFATVQELAGRNITKLLKRLYGDDVNLDDVLRAMRDQQLLEDRVKELRFKEGESDLVQFFQAELLGAQKEKYQQFVVGLRAQLENITSNRLLKPILMGQSDFDMDRHYSEGGILAVNTAMGKLKSAGDAFGMFTLMHLQNGTFRRPGTEQTRIPHFLLTDEYARYINPEVERFLSVGPEFRTAVILAAQSLGQLEVESGKFSAKAMKQAILTSCRNKISFGGLSYQDALEFSREFGKKQIISRQSTFKQQMLMPNLLPENYRDTEQEEDRIYYTQLMDGLPKFYYVARLQQEGTPLPPKIGKGNFIPRDWRERREWEVRKKQLSFTFHFKRKHKEHNPEPIVEEQTDTAYEEKAIPSSRLTFVDAEQPMEPSDLGNAEDVLANDSTDLDNSEMESLESRYFEESLQWIANELNLACNENDVWNEIIQHEGAEAAFTRLFQLHGRQHPFLNKLHHEFQLRKQQAIQTVMENDPFE